MQNYTLTIKRNTRIVNGIKIFWPTHSNITIGRGNQVCMWNIFSGLCELFKEVTMYHDMCFFKFSIILV
ncbi:hypothetical protein B0I21_1171 [Sphingobacterium paludis]|uniref:Uncharacterized protein n=1 Tax=Sphingobacterium paludis TaxID=1476465 RepID=A0A4R7CQB2_9SPHI|nr:hypothetical protein B0I21_1171 [Sphingobacterium paludis]